MANLRKNGAVRASDRLQETARRVIGVRLDEMEDLRRKISGPADSDALHNLRIAAKRLRYSLEMFAVAFPEGEAQGFADRVRAIQDLLGRIHDLDVLQTLLVDRIALLDEETRQRGLQIATGEMEATVRDAELRTVVNADDQDARLGLYTVIATKAAERRERYAEFETLWGEWERSGLLASIRDAAERGLVQPTSNQ